jgi:pimeloyl-ACP methyl ester carboxylesterase
MQRQQGTFLTNDGVRLAYEYAGVGFGKNNTGDSPVVLVHGWSGSKHYFDNSFSHILAGRNRPPMVVRYDLRGHGESEKPSYGYMVARFAADLRDLLDHLELDNVTLVGTSMGCAVIWSYLSLFGEGRVKAGVFVDQAPLQNRAPDWELGSRGCYDVPSLTRLQELLKYDYVGFAKGNAESCLSTDIDPALERLLIAETLKAHPEGLGQIMADHTAIDWRPYLRRIRVPCLVLAGGKSQIFPVEGVKECGRLIEQSTTVVFAREDHWLYIEDFLRFAELVCDFAYNGELTQGDGAPPEMPPLPMPERRRGGAGSRPGTSATIDSRFVQDMLDLATADPKEYNARSPSSRPPTSTTSPRLGNAMGPRVSGAKAPSRGTTPVGLPGTYRKPDLNSMDTAALEAELARRGKPVHKDFSRPSSRPTTGGSVRGMDPADQMPTGMDPADQMPTGMDPADQMPTGMDPDAEGLPGSNMPTAP